MKQSKFDEIQNRNGNNYGQICYELFCEEKKLIPREIFDHHFYMWLQIYKGSDILSAISYFKNNKITSL